MNNRNIQNNYNQAARKAAATRRKNAAKKRNKIILAFSLCIAVFTFIFLFVLLKADIAIFNFKSKAMDVYVYTPPKFKAVKLSQDNFLYENDKYLLSVDYAAKLLDFTVSGDTKKTTLSPMLSTNNFEFASFNAGSEDISVGRVNHKMSAQTVLKDNKLYIPMEFFCEFVDGFSFSYNEDTGLNEIRIPALEEGQKYIGIKLSSDDVMDKVNIIGESQQQNTAGKNTYITDISEYKQYIDPENPEEYLILISTESPLDKDYVPEDLTDIIFTRNDRKKQKMRKYAAMALEALLKEAAAAGFDDITVTSGYRDYAYQEYLFKQEIEVFRPTLGDQAEIEAAKHVAIPGTSEHQGGLCIDMHNLPAANQSFANTEAYKWLYSNCAKFGFILRFPNGKEDITGIIFEPWHYRYVGKTHAMKIMSQGLCLEEYLELLKQNEESEQ